MPAKRAQLLDLAERVEKAEGADRDALLAAAGFKPGPLGDGLKRKVILDDIAGLRGEMVRARRAERDSQRDAWLWQMHMEDTKGSGNGLLQRVWEQRRKVERENRHLRATMGNARAEGRTEVVDIVEFALRSVEAWSGNPGSDHAALVLREVLKRTRALAAQHPEEGSSDA